MQEQDSNHLYTVRGLYWDAGRPREFHQNGFWVEDEKLLTSGPVLGTRGDFLAEWVGTMVAAIRSTSSKQLIDVGQDEGGVTNRVLNQFYAAAGLSFTTNHTYWRDDAPLWDSVAAKCPGIPNIVGETGYQPVLGPDGAWRYDEISGYALLERKWALGFAAGNSGTLQWDRAREVNFGMRRSNGSAKIWPPECSRLPVRVRAESGPGGASSLSPGSVFC